jgi:hypothetical protein
LTKCEIREVAEAGSQRPAPSRRVDRDPHLVKDLVLGEDR